MAILEDLPGIKVSVESQGKVLSEYEDDADWACQEYKLAANKQKSVYVECTSDAEFKVLFDIDPPYELKDMLTFNLAIDGHEVSRSTASRRRLVEGHWSGQTKTTYERRGLDEVIRRKLKFASIQKVDDEDSTRVKNDVQVASGLGEILVTIYRTRYEPDNRKAKAATIKRLQNSPTEIAEKALKGKALSHGVAFGEEKRERRPAGSKNTRLVNVDGYKNPIGAFCFKYRSREALQQELIIPRSPSPDLVMSPLNPRRANASNEGLTREELLARLQREVDAIKSEVKKEDGRKKSQRGHKRLAPDEAGSSGRAYKTSRTRNGTVMVDLTDD